MRSFERIPVTLLIDGMTGSTWSQRPCPPASAYQHGRQTQKCRLFSSHLSRNYGLLEYDAVCFRIRVTKFRTNLTASHIQATRAKADGRKAIGNVGLGLKLHGVICRTTAILTLTALNASHRTTKSRTLKKKYLRGEVQLHAFLRANPDTTEVPLSHPSSFTMGGREGGRGESPWKPWLVAMFWGKETFIIPSKESSPDPLAIQPAAQ